MKRKNQSTWRIYHRHLIYTLKRDWIPSTIRKGVNALIFWFWLKTSWKRSISYGKHLMHLSLVFPCITHLLCVSWKTRRTTHPSVSLRQIRQKVVYPIELVAGVECSRRLIGEVVGVVVALVPEESVERHHRHAGVRYVAPVPSTCRGGRCLRDPGVMRPHYTLFILTWRINRSPHQPSIH